MSLVKLTIQGISASQAQSGAYVLVLSEVKGHRRLPVVIGGFEAQSIAIGLEENIKPPRPLTHDLFYNFAKKFDIFLKQIIIHKLVDGIFYTSIICERDGIEEIIDSRNSDAIALAIRFGAPIFTYDSVLQKAGVLLDSENKEDDDSNYNASNTNDNTPESNTYKELEEEKLKKMLSQAIKVENYEKATLIRDELKLRKNKNAS